MGILGILGILLVGACLIVDIEKIVCCFASSDVHLDPAEVHCFLLLRPVGSEFTNFPPSSWCCKLGRSRLPSLFVFNSLVDLPSMFWPA